MAEKLYPVVHDFLTVCGYTKTAAICLKDIGLDKSKVKTSESLISIYDSFKKSSKAIIGKKEESSDDSDSDEDSDEEVKPVPAPLKRKLPVAAVVKSKTQESSSEDDSSEDESDDESEDKNKKIKVFITLTQLV
jgi:hypothetical protein